MAKDMSAPQSGGAGNLNEFEFNMPGDDSPTDARTYYHRGNDYYEKEDYDKAIANYNMAIVLDPKFAEAYFNRGLCFYNKKDYDKAISDYTRASEIDPRNAVIYNNRGDAYYRKQDFDRAIVDYDKAIKLNNNYLKAFYNRGLAYACKQEYERAIEDFDKVVELNPNFAEAYHIRGLAYEYINNFEKAIKDYDKAIELNPDFTEAIQHREIAVQKRDGYLPPDAGTGGGAAGGGGGGGVASGGEGNVLNPIKLLSKPNVTFNNLAGMEKEKAVIKETIVYPLMQPELARKYGKFGGGAVLFYGPPGCGKTYLIKCSAGECNASFINVKISDVLDMYVGNTEKNLHRVFETAQKNAPCLTFFDEIDGLGGRRDQMGQQPYQKMAVNQLLFEMDGVESKSQDVLVCGATNSPWDIDPALRRSGRFSKTIFVPEPDKKTREEIFKMNCKDRPLANGINFGRLARATIGYASADIKQIVDDAASIPWMEAMREYMKKYGKEAKERPGPDDLKGIKQRKVTMGDFITAIRKKKSSLPPWYEQAKKQIGQQEELYEVDGKKHKKIMESKMGPGEKDAFKDLLDVIKKNNQWHYKLYKRALRIIALYLI